MAWLIVLLLIAGLLVGSQASTELLRNNDLEVTHYGGIWYCQGGCNLTSSTDSYSGQHSIKVSHRKHYWEGLAQNVPVTPGHRYMFTAYIKLLNLPAGALYQKAETKMNCKDAKNHTKYVTFGRVPMVKKLDSWTKLGGVNSIGRGYHSCHIYFQVGAQEVNYLVDHVSFQEVPHHSNWKSRANQRIAQIRKANVTINITGLHSATTTLQVELNQTRHEFAFGSAVDAQMILDPSYQHYQDFFYQNFEWGVPGNKLKWPAVEWRKGHFTYDTGMNAVNALLSHGIKVRAHNIFWGVEKHVPNWVKPLRGQDLVQAIHERVQGAVGHTKGKVEHWDVNNENLHGDFYEQHTGNPNITMEMFREAHAVDSKVKLFLNEFAIIGSADLAVALRDQALEFKEAGVPIYGIGIQSHVRGNTDITTAEARLNLVAEAGLPIWITELTVNETNENIKAETLSDLMTLYFSHPSVEGVLIWGFWDGRIWIPESALFEGPSFTPNAAGTAYQTLVHKTWRTQMTRTVHGNAPLHVSGFKGDYIINVRHNGQLLKTETFHLDKNGQTLQIHISGTGKVQGHENIFRFPRSLSTTNTASPSIISTDAVVPIK